MAQQNESVKKGDFLTCISDPSKVVIFEAMAGVFGGVDTFTIMYDLPWQINGEMAYTPIDIVKFPFNNFRHSTEEEKALMIEEMEKLGKRYNPETFKIEDMTKEESVKKLEVGKDYVNLHDNDVVVIDRVSDILNKGFERLVYKNYMSCSDSTNWREATEQEVVEAFKKHLAHRYGEDWQTMKIKERHPDSVLTINDGSLEVEIVKSSDGWNVWNKNGLLYCEGIWVERLVEENESVKKLEVGKDYISLLDSSTIVIDRCGDYFNKGFHGTDYLQGNIGCLYHPEDWREATEEEVIEAFKRHLVRRYGEDWMEMEIKERHPDSSLDINDGSGDVEILKYVEGWAVYNKNGLLYYKGIWVERLEEEPKIHIKEAIKENTVIHCETEEEAERILGMAHELGYKWHTGENYENDTEWSIYKSTMCYYLFDGSYSDYEYFKNSNYNIIPSTQIADLEPEKSTGWLPASLDIDAMNKRVIEKLPIDKVTTKNLDIALRVVGIQLDVNIIDRVIDLVELIENKGDDVTIKDIISLQQTWSRHSEAFH